MDSIGLAIKNTRSIVIGEITVKLIALFVAIYMARYLGVEKYGIYSFVTVYLTFFGIVGTFGLDTVIVRDIAREISTANKLINNIFTIRLIASSFAVLFAIVGIHLMDYSEDIIFYVTISSLILILQSLSYMNESLFRAKLRMEYFALSLIINKIFFAFLIFLAIFMHKDLVYMFVALVLSEGLYTLISFIFSKKFVNHSLEFDISCWKYLIREAIPFLMTAVFLIIHYRIDVIMLSTLKGSESVGLYSAAYKLTDPLLFIPGAISSSLLPIISKQFVSKKESMSNTFLYATRYTFILVLPMVLGIYVLSEKFISIIYGSSFIASAVVLKILIISLLFNSLNSMQNSVLISVNKQRIISFSIFISCCLNILFNFFLIPNYSYIGAAFATLCSVMMLYLIQFYYVTKLVVFPLNKKFFEPILSSIFMCVVILNIMELHIVMVILISIFTYFLSLILLKGYTEKDIEVLKRIIGKKLVVQKSSA